MIRRSRSDRHSRIPTVTGERIKNVSMCPIVYGFLLRNNYGTPWIHHLQISYYLYCDTWNWRTFYHEMLIPLDLILHKAAINLEAPDPAEQKISSSQKRKIKFYNMENKNDECWQIQKQCLTPYQKSVWTIWAKRPHKYWQKAPTMVCYRPSIMTTGTCVIPNEPGTEVEFFNFLYRSGFKETVAVSSCSEDRVYVPSYLIDRKPVLKDIYDPGASSGNKRHIIHKTFGSRKRCA